jgi:hypothetical protein
MPFADKLYVAELSNGAIGQMSFGIWDDTALYAFDIIGAEQVVKAFRASVSRQAQITTDADVYDETYETLENYRIEKQVLFREPTLYRWVFYPEFAAASARRVIFGFDAMQPGPALRAVLQETHHPTWPGCGAKLLEIGTLLDKIVPLSHTQNVAFAYHVSLLEWITVYDRGLQDDWLDIATLQAALRGEKQSLSLGEIVGLEVGS